MNYYSFCENLNVIPACNHCSYNVDFSYNFDMVRYCTLDHFILSGMLFANCVQTVSVAHDIDNTLDHDLLLLHLRLELQYVSLDKKEHSPIPLGRKLMQQSWVIIVRHCLRILLACMCPVKL